MRFASDARWATLAYMKGDTWLLERLSALIQIVLPLLPQFGQKKKIISFIAYRDLDISVQQNVMS